MIIEEILPYACRMDPSDPILALPGAQTPPTPDTLLPNLGVVNVYRYLSDLMMLTGLNGQERTLHQFDALLRSAGWRMLQVHRASAFASQIVAAPA